MVNAASTSDNVGDERERKSERCFGKVCFGRSMKTFLKEGRMVANCVESTSMLSVSSTENIEEAASKPVRGPSHSSCEGAFARMNSVDFVCDPFFA